LSALALSLIGAGYAAVNLVGARNGIDFDVYRAAGRAVTHNKSLFGSWIATQMRVSLPFTYPPFAALLAVPFGYVSSDVGFALWDVLSVIALAWVVRTTTRLSMADLRWWGLLIAVVVALALAPVQDALGFGQVGIFLMAMCIYDCAADHTRLPRGTMIGIATAIKLLPAMFIPYLWFSGRRRAALVGAATAVMLTLATFVVLPRDSMSYWTSRVFDNHRIGNNAYFSNQSLNGMLRRAFGSPVQVLWIVLATAVVVFGLREATRASRHGRELLGVCFVGLVTVLASPVSWIHHLVWIVPVLAALIGDGTDRRRVLSAVGVALMFTVRLPYIGESFGHDSSSAWIAGPLKDAYGLSCLALVMFMPNLFARDRQVSRPAPTP
jgi:alpha-1,2-mannosyltransferase